MGAAAHGRPRRLCWGRAGSGRAAPAQAPEGRAPAAGGQIVSPRALPWAPQDRGAEGLPWRCRHSVVRKAVGEGGGGHSMPGGGVLPPLSHLLPCGKGRVQLPISPGERETQLFLGNSLFKKRSQINEKPRAANPDLGASSGP